MVIEHIDNKNPPSPKQHFNFRHPTCSKPPSKTSHHHHHSNSPNLTSNHLQIPLQSTNMSKPQPTSTNPPFLTPGTNSPITPAMATTDTTEPSSTTASTTTSSDEEPNDPDRDPNSTLTRPVFPSRKSSGTNIVPRDHPDVEVRQESFSPGDARAMSPRRTSMEVEQLGRETRMALQQYISPLYIFFFPLSMFSSFPILSSPLHPTYSHPNPQKNPKVTPLTNARETPLRRHARTLQSGLNALAEKIEIVKSDHDKLERQNVALQDYIGGLTRSIRTDIAAKGKK